MKLLCLTSSGFRGLPDGEYAFSSANGEPHNLVFITGGPGSGKSSLLQAILTAKEAVGAYDDRKRSSCVASGYAAAELTAQWYLEPQEAALAASDQSVTTRIVLAPNGVVVGDHPLPLGELFGTFRRDEARPKVVLFHDDRVLPPTRGLRHSIHEPSEAADGHLQISRSLDKYSLVRPYIVRTSLADALSVLKQAQEEGQIQQAAKQGGLERLRDLFRPFLGDTVFEGISPEGHGYTVRFRRPDGSVVDLDDLTAFERQGVLFATTMTRCGVHSSLVLVDEPELHIRAGAQARFLEAVAVAGRNNQIIAATSSIELVTGAADAHEIDLSRSRDRDASPETRKSPAQAQVTAPAPRPDAARARIEPQASPSLVPSTPITPAVTAFAAPAVDRTSPSGAPSYLQAPPPPALVPPPVQGDNDDDGTVELRGGALKPALPFLRSAEPGGGSNATEELPAWGGPAPPGKRLIRFDPQTGRPLPKPLWVDAPEPSSNRQK